MSKGWTSERGGIIGVLFPIDMGNYARNSVGICEVFTRLNAASQSVRFVAYHWRRSGNFCFTADRGVNLQSVVQLGQDVTGLMCVVRTLDELKLVLAAVPPAAQSTKGGSIVLHTPSGTQKLIHVALSSNVPADRQITGQVATRVQILAWPSSRDVLCLYSRPSVGGDVGQVTQAVLRNLRSKMPWLTWHGTGRAISVIREIVDGTGLRTPPRRDVIA